MKRVAWLGALAALAGVVGCNDEADTGLEWRWKFTEARFEAPDASAFVVPEELLEEEDGSDEG